MKDIARIAGVHQTTVSLALRDHPSIAVKTRERIKAIAEEIEYRPDPMLASLIAYRKNQHAPTYQPTIAYIMNVNGPQGLSESQARQLFLEGAKKRASQLGYKLEVFYYGGANYHSRHLDRVLSTRNISGVIIAGFYTNYIDIELDWEKYSVVKIEALPATIRAHTVGNHQYEATRNAFRNLRQMGFRRIGLVVAEHDEKHMNNLFSAGYHVENHTIPEDERVPILVFKGNEFVNDLEQNSKIIEDWAVENDIDASLSNWDILDEPIAAAGFRLGRKLYDVSLDIDHFKPKAWGIRQNHESVGRSSLEVVAGLMHHNTKGLCESPRISLIEGDWIAPPSEIRDEIEETLGQRYGALATLGAV